MGRMTLPADFRTIVTDGASVLRSVGRALRGAAARSSDRPELWLSIRDVEGLAGRLTELPDAEWRSRAATLSITGQDVGVLEELLSNPCAAAAAMSDDAIDKVARLHAFLRRYLDAGVASG